MWNMCNWIYFFGTVKRIFTIFNALAQKKSSRRVSSRVCTTSRWAFLWTFKCTWASLSSRGERIFHIVTSSPAHFSVLCQIKLKQLQHVYLNSYKSEHLSKKKIDAGKSWKFCSLNFSNVQTFTTCKFRITRESQRDNGGGCEEWT